MIKKIDKYQVANRIKEQRRKLGLTQAEMGKLIGVTKGAISQWESALNKSYDAEYMLALTELFNINMNELLFGYQTLSQVNDIKPVYRNEINKEAALEALTFINKHFTPEIREEMGEEWVIDRFIKLYNASAKDQLKNTDSELILGLIN